MTTLDQYLNTSYRPDCDFISGAVVERNVGLVRHSYAVSKIATWLGVRKSEMNLQPLLSLRMQTAPQRVLVPDVVAEPTPVFDGDILTHPPFFCVEVISPEDNLSALLDRTADYVSFGVPNVWVIDPWKHRGWHATTAGWLTATDGVMRTSDGRAEMPSPAFSYRNCPPF